MTFEQNKKMESFVRLRKNREKDTKMFWLKNGTCLQIMIFFKKREHYQQRHMNLSKCARTICWKTIPFLWGCLCSSVENQLSAYMYYSWTLYSGPLISLSVFRPTPHCCTNCCFITSLKIRPCCPSNVVLFQSCLG